MWGNLTGWIISAVLAALMGGTLYYVAAPPSRTSAINSPKLDIARKEVVLPVAADTVVASGKSDCDAADLYRKAIQEYASAAYEKFDDAPTQVAEKDLGGIEEILKARDCRNCNLFSKDFAKVVNYDNSEPPIDALEKIGGTCCTFGLLYVSKENPNRQPERAVKLWEAAFVLGRHLYDERACWAEYQAGHALMAPAAAALAKYYRENNDIERADKIQSFMDAEAAQASKMQEAYTIIGGVDENYFGKYAGDIFAIAESKKADKMFRVEALKHIGHYRFNSLTTGDQLGARRVVRKLMEDPSAPGNIKAAANAAHNLTIEQHRIVG